MENVTWPCPLTVAQRWLVMAAGLIPYQGTFLVHYLSALVSPTLPLALLRWGALAVCAVNLGVYARRHGRAHLRAYHHLPIERERPKFSGSKANAGKQRGQPTIS